MNILNILFAISFLTFSVNPHSHSHSQQHHHSHHHQHHHHESSKSHSQHNSHQDHNQHNHFQIQNKKQYSQIINNQTKKDQIRQFMIHCQPEVGEWILYSKDYPLEKVMEDCQVELNAEGILLLYQNLAEKGSNFVKEHIDVIITYFRKNPKVREVLKCMVQKRTIENKYFEEKKKYKYLAQFLKEYPVQGKEAFLKVATMSQKGSKFCHFLKALFEYYYLYVLSPSQTLSTQFFRALTVRSTIFNHEDIAYCVSIQTVSKLTTLLQDLNINNIYLRVPEIFNAVRFMKLKQKCRSQQNLQMMRNLQSQLKNLDFFRIMYNDYEPFVQIAAEKFTQTQIRLLARKLSDILENRQNYLRLSKQQLDNDL